LRWIEPQWRWRASATENCRRFKDAQRAGTGDKRLCAECETIINGGTPPPEPEPPYHSIYSHMHHVFDRCTLGNNIEPRNHRPGEARHLCRRCERMLAGEIER
jgi:hypothetical protein